MEPFVFIDAVDGVLMVEREKESQIEKRDNKFVLSSKCIWSKSPVFTASRFITDFVLSGHPRGIKYFPSVQSFSLTSLLQAPLLPTWSHTVEEM